MPKKARELSAAEVRRISSSGLHAVGGVAGLHLQVTGEARSWVLRVMVGAKRRDIGLGGFPDVPLASAREKARELRELIRQGIDPAEQRRAARQALIAEQARTLTFDEAARRFLAIKQNEFRNPKHTAQWASTLATYASPIIGHMAVADIELPDILNVLQPIWNTKTETATRLRGRIESVLTWATVSGYRKGDNPARFLGNIEVALGTPAKKVKHFTALPVSELGQFMADLRKREGIAPRALEFAILTAARSGEVRGATWDEIDIERRIWTIPAERMKGGKIHRVPLSEDAVALLKALPRMAGSDLLFTAPKGGQFSDTAMLAVLKRMGVAVTGHGFRSTFKDWARENTRYPDEASELALAHVNSDKTRAAYARSELIEIRTRMMADWAKFCSTIPTGGAVVPLGKKRA